MLTTKQKLKENITKLRFNWWRKASDRRVKLLNCLCVMCHQERKVKAQYPSSIYANWCDECFIDLPLWLRFEKTTADELKELDDKQREAADIKREIREAKARKIAAKKKQKKIKLTGFENVQNEELPMVDSSVDIAEVATNYERQRQQLESLFYYESDD